ncbi:Protein CLT2 chloroplastic [Bienertia sinuspersici]
MPLADIFGVATVSLICHLGKALFFCANNRMLTCGCWCCHCSLQACHQVLSGIAFVWPALMIASGAFHAAASILKHDLHEQEFIFVDAAARLKGKSLDIFVVNSFGSGCQALFVLVLLPMLSNLKGIPFDQLPQYFQSGVACFLNIGADKAGKFSYFGVC